MSRLRGLVPCASFALSVLLLASNGGTLGEPAGASPGGGELERGTPALFSWGDLDGDERLDLAAVSADGTLQLLRDAGAGRFQDVTGDAGLGALEDVALALWADYDRDGRADLFVGARAGRSRLYHNEGGVFVDVSAATGLAPEGSVQAAQWFDHDGDGWLDLFVVAAGRNTLFHGLEGGFFEASELPLGGVVLSGPGGIPPAPNATGPQPTSDTDHRSGGRDSTRPSTLNLTTGPASSSGATTSGGSVTFLMPPPPMSCMDAIKDQANLPNCLQASTTPTLGRLFPISSKLFVAVGGNVGVGTTAPTAKLEVAGTARVTDTLTLAPSGDTALDVSTGSIYKGGALFIHTKGGTGNTAQGTQALASVTTGTLNTATGYQALFSNTSHANTATGYRALYSNTTGSSNTAIGDRALRANTTGTSNTASGARALDANTTGNGNSAFGSGTLGFNTTGYTNSAFGMNALLYNTTGAHNTATGYRTLHKNTTGFDNTASGYRALSANTTGYSNTASGFRAVQYNTSGGRNTALGVQALYFNTSGFGNTAIGYRALKNNTTGFFNIAIGPAAGFYVGGNNNIMIGHYGYSGDIQTTRIGQFADKTFIDGIRGVTTDIFNAIPVYVDGLGQLGTASSSRRFKKDIADMGDLTERLLELRPVVFHYKKEQKGLNGDEAPLEYGLIAEEVAEIFPDLVVYDEEGQPFTVKYHLMSAMLLNELIAMKAAHERRFEELEDANSALEARLALLESVEAEVAGRKAALAPLLETR